MTEGFRSMKEVLAKGESLIEVHSFPIPGVGVLHHRDLPCTRRDIFTQWQARRIMEAERNKTDLDMTGSRSVLMAVALCDPDGHWLSTDPVADAELLQDRFPSNHLYDITDEIMLVNGLNKESEEDTLKNSSMTGTPSSGSSCPPDGEQLSENSSDG